MDRSPTHGRFGTRHNGGSQRTIRLLSTAFALAGVAAPLCAKPNGSPKGPTVHGSGSGQGATTPLSIIPLTELSLFSENETAVSLNFIEVPVSPESSQDQKILEHVTKLRHALHEIDVKVARKFPLSPLAVATPDAGLPRSAH